ncbi:MAG: hypothetical protein B6D56_08100 [Candidatus Omnitrophica bacterium 4484_70.1]|nr:MAG: hypothetical protein B6D56_08100 [Candidatus Omnitrophica bacterium 4484_70.1]
MDKERIIKIGKEKFVVRFHRGYFPKTGRLHYVVQEIYSLESPIKRMAHSFHDEPALIEYFPDGKVKVLAWYKFDKLHRDGNKPAKIVFDENRNEKEIYFLKDGAYHRDKGPAIVKFDEKGKAIYLAWYKNGVLHSEGDKPAIVEISRIPQCFKATFFWYRNNQRHREGIKPAYVEIKECKEEKKVIKRYFKYGVEFKKEFLERLLESPLKKETAERILMEGNTQVRMAMIQTVGWGNLLRVLESKLLDKSEDGQYELLQFDGIFPIPMKVLKMRCPTVGVYYFVPVHPDCETVQQALDFYYGGSRYNFIWEK